MSEVREIYGVDNNLLQSSGNPATMEQGPPDAIQVSRKELEQEHIHLMARIQQLRRLLGFPPLPTGSQRRRQHE